MPDQESRLPRPELPPLPEPATLYGQLLASLGSERCPLCTLLRLAARGPEVVAAAATRPGAACAPHRRRLAAAAPAAPALARLQVEWLTAWHDWLVALQETRAQPWRRVANWLAQVRSRGGRLPGGRRAPRDAVRSCPACRWLSRLDRAAGRLLLDHLDDLPVRERFVTGRGLCAPHFEQVRSATPRHRHLGELLAYEKSAVSELVTAARSRSADRATRVRAAEALEGPASTASPTLAVDASPPPRDEDQMAPQADGDDPATLRLEVARLRARLDDVQAKWQADRVQLTATRYRLWETSEAKRRLEMNLAGAEGEIALLSRMLDERRATQPPAVTSGERGLPPGGANGNGAGT